MKSISILFFILIYGAQLAAQPFSINHLYPIEGSHSFVEFEVTYMGTPR